jgi:hypothetical protein
MGTNIVKALKLLGSTIRKPFFQFQNQANAKICDSPHFLKCTRNLFLKYDVEFEPEHLDGQLSVIAKWGQIDKLFKHDMICMQYKLTDTRLSPVTHCAMKVSLAAQVMSHRVAAGIYSLVSNGRVQCLHSFNFH